MRELPEEIRATFIFASCCLTLIKTLFKRQRSKANLTFLQIMKKFKKIFLLTILSFCYINTVFEYSDCEKKANFESESHCYIHIDNNDFTTPTVKTVQHFDIAFHLQHLLTISTNSIDKDNNSFHDNYFSPPPQKQKSPLWWEWKIIVVEWNIVHVYGVRRNCERML